MGEHVGTLFNLGNLLKQQGRLDEAEQAYRRTLAADPTNTIVLRRLSELFRKQGRHKEAEELQKF
eukprot:NODE_5816_length_300_cov_144.258964_g5204_i0.p2 GENE.NODE_5816_length_300_cov_144.258964_g5204_i0~~NODE_5816_length_300_cov_144.258964_g5204_i0.p2  ORF type:complete len:65 (+),score=10.53 NODE_5816_length_300_cov_144.258964_g5204_i0:30-224(+)